MAKARLFKFVGRTFEIILRDDVYGNCQLPGEPLAIVLMEGIETKHGLDTLLHECLHAQNPKRSERWVDARATELADVLWRLGFRRK